MTAPTALTSDITVGAGTLYAASITIPGSATGGRFASISVSTGNIGVTGAITFSGVSTQARYISTGASTLTIGGNFGSGGTLTTSSTGTMVFNGGSAQTMGIYATYNNIQIANTSGGVSILGAVTLLGTLTINTGGLTFGGFTTTVTGVTTINNGGTLTLSSATGAKTFTGAVTINVGGTWTESATAIPTFSNGLTNNGTLTAAGGVHTFSTNSQTIGGSSAISIASITVTGAGISLTNNATTSGLTIATALSGTGWFIQGPGSIVNLGGTFAITTFSATSTTNVVNFNSASAQTIPTITYTTLKINNTNASGATLAGAITLTTLTIGDVAASSLFADAGFTITPSGSSVLNLTQGTYKLGTVLIGNTMPAYATMNISSGSTVQYASSAATQTISSTPNYQNITFTGTSTKTANGNLSVGGNFTVNATSQTVNLSSFTHSIVGNIVITLGTLDASTSVTTLQGNLSGAGTFTGNASTLNLTGSNTQTLGATSQIFNNMSVSKNATSTTASFTTAATVNGTFTVGTATFSIGGFATVFNSTVTISGVLNITSATGAKIFPTVILNTGSTWNNSGNSTVTFRGSGITYNGSSFTSGSGVQTFDTNAQTVSGSSAFTITNMTVTGAGISVTNTNTGGLTITTALAGTGWFIQGTNGSVILPGTFAITTFSATSTGNTVNYSGATQTAKPINYYNLTLSGSGNKTLTTVATISGDFVTSGTVVATSTSLTSIGSRLIIGSGTTYTNNNPMTVSSTTLISGTIIRTALGTGTIFTGLVTVDSTGIWTTIASATGKFRGGIQNDGSFVTGPAVSVSFVFDTNAQTISGSSPISIGDVTLDKDITNNNTAGLTISSLFGSTTATTNFTQGTNALLYIRGTVSTLSGVVINASATGNTVDYMATTAQTAKSATYYTLNINNTNASGVQLGGAVTTTNLNIGNATSSSIFDDGGFVITPSGTTSFYLGTSSSYKIGSASVATTFPTFNTTTIVVGGSPSTVIYQSAVNQTISTSPTYANLTINGSSTKILSDTATTTIQNNLVLNAGTLHFCDTGVSCVVAIGANGIVGIATGTYINGGGTINSASGNISAAGTGSFSNTGLVRITGNTAGSNFSPNGGTMNQINIEKTAGVLTYFASSTTVATLNVISGLLTFDTGTTTVTGVTTISDSFDIDNATGAKTFGGAVVINSGATWTNTGATSAIFQGGLTFNGSSFSSGSGTYTFNTNSQSIGGSTAFTIQNIAVTGVTLTNNSTVGLTVSNLLSGTGGLTQAASSVLTISSSTSITTLTASASLNTVNYTATLAQTIKAATYYDISLTGGTKTISSGTTVNNNLSLSTNAVATTAGNMTIGNSLAISTSSTLTTGSNFTLNVGGATVVSGVLANAGTALKTYTGSVGINGGGSFTSANNGNITLRGGFTNNAAGGSVSFGTGTITFDTNDQSVSGTNPVSIENITVTGITLSNLTSTFLNASSSLSGTGTLYQGTSTVLLINGSSGITTLLASTSPNTVVYASTTAAQTVKSSTYNALKIDKTSQTATLGGAITVNANLSILAGTLDTSSGNNYAITVKGDWINTGTFTPRSGTVTFNSASTQTINNTNNWFGLAITGTTAARTVYFESSATQNIATSGVLTLTGGALKLLTLAPLTAATPWNLHVVNSGVTQTISYVSVSYSDASPFTYAQITAGDGTNTDGTNNTNWSFTNVTTISFSLSANTIGFGNLSSSLARFATNDSLGSASEVEAHQVVAATNAPSGYNLAIQGSTLNCGANTITSIGGTNTASSVGTEQFGIRATATGGSGTVTSPYAASGFAYAGTATTTSQIGSSVVPTATTTYSIRYLANITANTEACNYSSVLNFILTPNF